MKLKSLPSLILVASFTLFSGCVAGKPQPITLSSIKVAANVGTAIALSDRQDWRPQFVLARDQLGTYLTNGSISGEQLAAILAQLPVQELKSDTARIIISSATILFDDYIRQATDVNKLGAVKDVAQAIYDGLDAAIKATPEQLKAVKANQKKGR